MRYLSVCSGIEAATVAWHQLGWTPEAYSEIEKFPAAVLAHHYPQTPNLGDMTNYKEWNIGEIDLLVGGTPCQSFSVAGLRKGLDDPRGNLALVYLGIAERFHPRWLLWENVPGVLSSSGGRDFGSFLGAMAQLGYGFAYRVLDAQYFGVPQRRRRVFVVGYLGDWRRAAAVLFESHSLQGHPAPSRKAGEEVARNVAIGIDEECNATINGIGPLLRGGQGGTRTAVACFQQNTRDEVRYLGGDGQIAGALAASAGMKQTNYICAPLSTTVTNGPQTGNERVECEAPIICHGTQDPCVSDIAFAQGRNNGGENVLCAPVAFGVGESPDLAHCLRSGASKADKHESTTYVASPMQVRRLTPTECERLQGFPDGYTNTPKKVVEDHGDGPCAKQVVIATLVAKNGTYFVSSNHCATPKEYCQRAGMPSGEGYDLCQSVCGQSGHAEVNAIKLAGKFASGGVLYITGHTYACDSCVSAAKLAGVMKIIIGAPPTGTSADGPRYKALGNSMAVPCMRWLGERIQMVDEI